MLDDIRVLPYEYQQAHIHTESFLHWACGQVRGAAQTCTEASAHIHTDSPRRQCCRLAQQHLLQPRPVQAKCVEVSTRKWEGGGGGGEYLSVDTCEFVGHI